MSSFNQNRIQSQGGISKPSLQRNGPSEAPRSLPSCPSRLLALPHDTALILDASTSMGETDLFPTRLDAAKEAALAFISIKFGASMLNRVGLVEYQDEGEVRCGLSSVSKRDELEYELDCIESGGNTNISGGLIAAQNMLFPNQSASNVKRRIEVILLTDGWDNFEGNDPACVADELINLGCFLYTVGIGSDPDNVDEGLLQRMASVRADGTSAYRFIDDPQVLTEHFENIARGITR